MTDLLHAGVIGCGNMSRNHVAGYVNSGRYVVVALADLSDGAMDQMDGQFNLTTNHYTDARRMLAAENLDVVSIGT